MRRLSVFFLCLMLSFSLALSVSAANVGDVVGHALHTDITAMIDGHPLRCFNIDGRTAVVAEDLRGYGFQVTWKPEVRRLEVERAREENGYPWFPRQWPQYQPEDLTAPIGSRAEDIFCTDIVTTVAGEEVQGFNIGGETVIFFSDLDPYGEISWDGNARIAGLGLEDPWHRGVSEQIASLESWKEFSPSSSYELYSHVPADGKGTSGTLVVSYYSGTTHGGAYRMTYVDSMGTRLNINSLLPRHGFGVDFYLRPRDIQIEGDVLSFITPVKETLNWQEGTWKDWGECLCAVNLKERVLISMIPLEAGK